MSDFDKMLGAVWQRWPCDGAVLMALTDYALERLPEEKYLRGTCTYVSQNYGPVAITLVLLWGADGCDIWACCLGGGAEKHVDASFPAAAFSTQFGPWLAAHVGHSPM